MMAMRDYCVTEGIRLLGKIPYDPMITEAQREAKTILEYAPESAASEAIRAIHNNLVLLMEESKNANG